MQLHGKRAVVTGSGGGRCGRAIAKPAADSLGRPRVRAAPLNCDSSRSKQPSVEEGIVQDLSVGTILLRGLGFDFGVTSGDALDVLHGF